MDRYAACLWQIHTTVEIVFVASPETRNRFLTTMDNPVLLYGNKRVFRTGGIKPTIARSSERVGETTTWYPRMQSTAALLDNFIRHLFGFDVARAAFRALGKIDDFLVLNEHGRPASATTHHGFAHIRELRAFLLVQILLAVIPHLAARRCRCISFW